MKQLIEEIRDEANKDFPDLFIIHKLTERAIDGIGDMADWHYLFSGDDIEP